MKDKDSQGEKWGFWKKALVIFPVSIVALAISIFVGLYAFYSIAHWWSANTVNNTINNPPPSLEVAVAVLTILVAIIAIYASYTSITTKSEWDKFQKEQAQIIKETSDDLEKLKEETEEINWLDQLRESMKDDPRLESDDAKEKVESIKKHYFKRDQYNEAWKYFGVARRYENEEQYSDAITYHEKAVIVDLEEDNIESNELHKHIWQSLGKNYFLRGRQREESGEKKEAIKDYEAAIVRYDWVIEYDPQFAMAHFNKASTLIQLGKIKGDKTEPYNDANYCYKKAIKCLGKIEDNYDHFYDKARAHALLDQGDKAIESLRRSFTLAKRDNLGKLFYYLARDSGDFKYVEGKAKFKALVERYRDIYKGTN